MSDVAAFWDARFAEPGFKYGSEPNAFLRAHAAQFAPAAQVLVPGDGDREGRNGVWLAQGLRPGGRLVLEAFHPAQLALRSGGPKDLDLLYTPDHWMMTLPTCCSAISPGTGRPSWMRALAARGRHT